MSQNTWKSIEDDAAEPAVAMLRRGRVRLEFGDQEFVLVLEPNVAADGRILSVRVALRRGGGAFSGPGRTYPAVGSIYESLMVTLTGAAMNLQSLGPSERGQITSAGRTVLERAARRLNSAR